MSWIVFVVLAMADLVTLFVVLTDGRYFGQRLARWLYDRFAPSIFAAHYETRRWHNLAEILQLREDEHVLDVGTAIGDLPLSRLVGYRRSSQS